jgi:hypothetical protein
MEERAGVGLFDALVLIALWWLVARQRRKARRSGRLWLRIAAVLLCVGLWGTYSVGGCTNRSGYSVKPFGSLRLNLVGAPKLEVPSGAPIQVEGLPIESAPLTILGL